MFTAFVSVVLLAASTNGLTVPLRREDSCQIPITYAKGQLEDFCSYHDRYVTLDCASQRNTTFFDDCCHPMLVSEVLSESRKEYCIPTETYESSAADVAEAATEDVYTAESTSVYVPEPEMTSYEVPAETTEYIPTSTIEEAATSTTTKKKHTSTPTPDSSSDQSSDDDSADDVSDDDVSDDDDSDSSDSGSSSETFSGTATYYFQNGNPGACGDYHSDDDFIVAIPYALWGGSDGQQSSNCGKYVTLTNDNTGESVSALIADLCPTCDGTYSIDLSYAAFTSLAKESDGIFPISYHFN